MNDDVVIERLRHALDEVTAGAGDEVIPLRSGARPRRNPVLLAGSAVACVALLGAAVWVFSRRDPEPVATAPEPTAAGPTAPALPTTTAAVIAEPLRFALIAADLVAQTPTTVYEGNVEWTAAWVRASGAADGLLTLKVYPAGAWTDPSVASVTRDPTDPSRELVFQSFGITAEQRSMIAAEVVAGSGLPYVLPNSDWVYLGSGEASLVAAVSQVYMADDDSSRHVVRLQEGSFTFQFDELLTATTITAVPVGRFDGWRAVQPDGSTRVVWDADGLWVTMTISPALADRADGLIAAVVDRQQTSPATPVPAPQP